MPNLAATVALETAVLPEPGGLSPSHSARTRITTGSGVLLFVSFGVASAIPVFFPTLWHAFHCLASHLAALFSITLGVSPIARC